jgi:hypothetical protein
MRRRTLIKQWLPEFPHSFDVKRRMIQLAELKYNNVEISCDRDEPVPIQLYNLSATHPVK